MAIPHTEMFQVRHDECDAYGVLNNAVYLRLAQEAAWRHSASAGFPPDWYVAQERAWIARDTQIEYLAPVRYGDLVEVTTYVPAIRRALARRAYKFRVRGSTSLVATAHTDWVYLDTSAERPASIPDELVQALFEPGERPAQLEREAFPEPPGSHAEKVTWRGRVQWRDIDSFGHLNNAAYFSYTEAAAGEAGLQFGITPDASEVGWTLKRSRMQYLQPARFPDELEIETWLSSLRKASAERQYEIYRAGDRELLARSTSLWLTIDLVSGRPRRIPDWMVKALAPNLAQPSSSAKPS